MENKITELSYAESYGSKSSDMKLTIEFASRKVIIDTHEERQIRKCTEADWQKIEKFISKCNFMKWKNDYFEPVLDGMIWGLGLSFMDGSGKSSHGTNGFPTEWKQFQSLKRFCQRLMKQDD